MKVHVQSVFTGVLTGIEDFREPFASGAVAITATADDGAGVGGVCGGAAAGAGQQTIR